jgi:uncharacterized protein (DUF952 family)
MLYHVVTESNLRAQLSGDAYVPSDLDKQGFVHCSFAASVIPVANDYFAAASGSVLVLEIDPGKLTSEVRHETASPIAGGGASHLASASQFPHVYGPIDTDAITGVGVLGRSGEGYEWPAQFMALVAFLAGHP